MPIGDRIGGFIRPGFNPLLAPGAPTIGTASSGGALNISIAFTAPSDVGGGAITSYEAVATDTVTAAVFTGTAASSPVTITGLTEGQSYTTTVTAINAYGPSGISAASNSVQAETVVGELWSWGYNNMGQLGLGDTTDRSSPVQVGALITWKQLSMGERWTAATTADGKLYTWGEASDGQLGHSNTTALSSPVQVGALTTWSNVASLLDTSASVKTDGTLWTWGSGTQGRLGDGTTVAKSSPIQVGALTDWLRVSAGTTHCLSTKTDGTLWSWGSGGAGQLGDNAQTNRSSPVQVGVLTTWATIKAGSQWSAGITTDGKLYIWGVSSYGAGGQGNTTETSSPVQVGALTTWAEVACAKSSAIAVKTDGTLWTWGYATYGLLGNGTTSPNISSPVQVGSLTNWALVIAGDRNVYAVKTDGTLWAWGIASNGALGNGTTSPQINSPIQIGALTTWLEIPGIGIHTEGSGLMIKTVS